MVFSQNEIESYSMNDLYAIDPRAPRGLSEIKILSDLFGFSHGRFIARYPNDWEKLLSARRNELSDNDNARLTILIKRLSENTIPLSEVYRMNQDWLANVLKVEDKEKKFKKVVCQRDIDNNHISMNKFLYEQDIPDARGDHVRADVKTYQQLITPLFLVSTEIHFQDMYFYFFDRGRRLNRSYRVLKMFLHTASLGARCEKLIFHLNGEKFDSDCLERKLQDDLMQAAQECGCPNIEMEYSLEDRRLTHGRYVFSIKGGLQFDHGFDIANRESGRLNHVHWLSEGELTPLWDRYGI